MKELGYLLLAAIAIAVYFLPTIIAVKRQHAYKGIIAVINIVFGLTGIGWAGALIWAIFPAEKSLIDPFVGNPTGTGIRNAGDTFGAKKVGEERGYIAEKRLTEELDRLIQMKGNGDISETEFQELKRKLISGN